jgi:hypothetical protein
MTLFARSSLLVLAVSFVTSALAQVLTVQVGAPALPPTPLVEHTNIWRWHKGTNAPQTNWQSVADASLNTDWGSGPGGFGYSTDTANETNQCRTVLSDMRGAAATNYPTFYIRRTFTVGGGVDTNLHLQLTVDYDDAFVAYLDGVEVARSANTPTPVGTEPAYNSAGTSTHESSRGTSTPVNPPAVFDIGPVGATGTRVLAIMGLNTSPTTSSDFILIASLALSGGSAANPSGAFGTLVTSNSVTLSGSNSVAGSTRVTVNGDDATYVPASNTWSRVQTLQPGMNRLFVASHDAAGNIVSNITADVIYQTSSANIGGTLATNAAFAGSGLVVYVTNSVTVPANLAFEVSTGAVVLVSPSQRIITQPGGTIRVRGTFEQPVCFNVNGATNQNWGPLSGTGTNAVIDVRFADVSHAQVNATTNAHGLIEDTFIHDFDPGSIGTLLRPILHCNFASLFEVRRVRVRNYYECLVRNGVIQIEQCLFEDISGDALDFDSAQPGSYTRNCTYRHGNRGNVDAVDIGPADLPGSTDTRIENCIMWDFPFDKGVSVGDGGSSHGIIVSNCLIYGCNAGVMSKDLCDVSVRNCTIVGNDSGLTNYNKASPSSPTGGGVTTNSYNNIVWGNIAAIGMANGGQLFADHNDFGNTNWPGAGNFDLDPLFVNPAVHDYRLQPGSPCLTNGRNGDMMGVTYPLGGVPGGVLRLVVFSNGTNAPVLNWVDDSQNEDGVVVQRSTDALNWMNVANLAAETTNHTDDSAVLGQRYYYRVQHTNYVAASPFSNVGSGIRQAPLIYVGGTIAADTVWGPGSTVVVTSSVTVSAGVTLTIHPCTQVLFNQGLSLTVNGTLRAIGTPECRILFTRNTGATSWSTIDLFGASSTHELRFVDIAYSTGNVDATSTAVIMQNAWWTNTTAQLLDCVGSSMAVLQCYVPGGAGVEPIHFSSMPSGGYALVQSNIFGAPQGYNDSIDFTGGNRPGGIVQFLDNIFLAAVDDCMDLDGTDAHIEGNIFLNVHQDAVRSSTANPISTGADGGNRSELVAVRNIIYNCDHALLLKDLGSAVFENNTVVTIQTNSVAATRAAYVQFGEPHRNVPGGRGIVMNGNILWDLHSDTPFIVFTNGTMFMTANDNIIHGTNMTFGGNSTNDPMFVNWQTGITWQNIRSNLALLPGSPAIGTGPNGLDRGALVPSGATISGEPPAVTTNTSATLTVAGPGKYAYKWKLNDGPWSAEVPLTNDFLITATLFSNAAPITLAGLTNGTYTVSVIGKNSAGFWQDTNSPTLSRTWTVVPAGPVDTDNDGIPDDWEIAHGLNATNAADAALDADLDGMSNLQEFLAGTDPQDPASRLALAIAPPSGGAVELRLNAISNKSYTVQYRLNVATGAWLRLQDIPVAPTNRDVILTNNVGDPERFFRIVTPVAP